MNTCKVKICGTTSVGDALIAAEAGADYSGIAVEIPHSERAVSVEKAVTIVRATPIPSVALFIDMPIEFIESAVETIKPFAIQLLGHESPEFVATLKKRLPCQVWKSICLPVKGQAKIYINDIKVQMDSFVSAGADALLLDTVAISGDKLRFGGTGKVSDWNIARELVKSTKAPVFLAGGINPDNVREAIQTVKPYGIDLCSGVEKVKAKRDYEKVNRLMENFRLAVEQ
ncbi:TPA: phosphoribosylanthranilate isomerase [Candidatus Poribacteria bacterium]|nr:phosphoribosylanthranilate isomerase [Candidatus Poribacteria bacterium]